jgi:hypothetical protein
VEKTNVCVTMNYNVCKSVRALCVCNLTANKSNHPNNIFFVGRRGQEWEGVSPNTDTGLHICK